MREGKILDERIEESLNNRCDKNIDQHNDKDNIYDILNKTRKRKHNKHRCRIMRDNDNLSAKHVLENILELGAKDIPSYINSTLPQMNKSNLRELGLIITDYIPVEESYVDDRILNLMLDMINHKLLVKEKNLPKKTYKKINPVIIIYENAAVNFINLQGILNEPEIRETFKPHSDEEPTVVYKYTKPIRSQILNYAMDNVDIEFWDEQQVTCQCDTTYKDFRDSNHNHVVTGNLNIIGNKRLRNLF